MAILGSLSLIRPLLQLPHRPHLVSRLPSQTQIRFNSKKSAKAVKALKSTRQATVPTKTPQPLPRKPKAPRKKPLLEKVEHQSPTIFQEPNYHSLEYVLSQAPGETLLYHRPLLKHNLACYGITGMAVWMIYNTYDMNIRMPSDVSRSKIFQAMSYFSMGLYTLVGVGAWAVSMRMIRTIRAVPYHPNPQSPPSIQLLVLRNNILPIFPPLKKLVPLDEIYLQRSLHPRPSPPKGKKLDLQAAVQAVKNTPFRVFSTGKEFLTRDRCVQVFIKSKWFNLVLHEDGYQWQKNGLELLLGTKKKWQA